MNIFKMRSSLPIIVLLCCVASACWAFTMPKMGNTVVPPPSRKHQQEASVARENSKRQHRPSAIPDPATSASLVSTPTAPSWMSTPTPHGPMSGASAAFTQSPTRRQAVVVSPDPAGFRWGVTPPVSGSSSSRSTSNVAAATGSMSSTLKSSSSEQKTTTQRASVMSGTGSLLARSVSVPSRQTAMSSTVVEPKPPQTSPPAAAVSSALNADSPSDSAAKDETVDATKGQTVNAAKEKTVEMHKPTAEDVKEKVMASMSGLASKLEQAKASLNGLVHKLEESVAKKSATLVHRTIDEAPEEETQMPENKVTKKQIEPDVEKINNAWVNVQVGPRVGPKVNAALINSASTSATGFIVTGGSNKNKKDPEAASSSQTRVISGNNNQKPDQIGSRKAATIASEMTQKVASPAKPASNVNEESKLMKAHSSTVSTSEDLNQDKNRPHLDAAVTEPDISAQVIPPPSKAAAAHIMKENADGTAGSPVSETAGALNGKSLVKDESESREASISTSMEVSSAGSVADFLKDAVTAPSKAINSSSSGDSAFHDKVNGSVPVATLADSPSILNGVDESSEKDESSGDDNSVPEFFFARYVETKVHNHQPETAELTVLVESNGKEKPETDTAQHESTNPASAALYHYY
jgi:hypothetical protein